MRDKGLPAKTLTESGDGAFLASDVRNVVAGFLSPRFSRCAEPRPRPTYGVFRSTCFAQVTLSNPSTRCALNTWAIASTSVAASVMCRLPRPLGGVRAASLVSAWPDVFPAPPSGVPHAWGAHHQYPFVPCRDVPGRPAPHGPSTASPSAASPWCPRSLVRTRRANSPLSPGVTPAVIQASMASAVAPVNGNGDR